MLDAFVGIRFTDVVDILLVAALLYTAIVWVRRTQAGFVAIGILILGALYIAARAFDLRLMTGIFQGFFAIFVVIIVVIFQEELRQLFERVAVWSLRQRKAAVPQFTVADILVRCAADFARDRIGALIVVPGNQPLQRHLQGGIELNGHLSEPLLKSIFDPHSAGHDGAVIVEHDRVSRFAVHLPLSRDFQQLSRVGTRHSAALGLAECTDALCLVVSEERGRISVAKDGRLREVANLQELGSVLHEFLQEKRPSRKRRPISLQLVRENWVEKVAALALVIGLWYVFVPGSRPAEITYKVPVKVVNLPAGMVVQGIEPREVKATFLGIRRSFYLFDSGKLEVTVDASLAELGRRTFQISEQNVRYPKELTLEELRPSKVKISVGKRATDDAETGDARKGQRKGG